MTDRGMILVFIISGMILAYFFGVACGNEAMRQEAVRVGAAENSINGWRWKENK